MKRLMVQTKKFSQIIDELIRQKKLAEKDFLLFEQLLCENPDIGDTIQGSGGLRKTRLKSANRGKSAGFRVCYLDQPERERLFLITIFPKNVKANLSKEEKQVFKNLVMQLKKQKG